MKKVLLYFVLILVTILAFGQQDYDDVPLYVGDSEIANTLSILFDLESSEWDYDAYRFGEVEKDTKVLVYSSFYELAKVPEGYRGEFYTTDYNPYSQNLEGGVIFDHFGNTRPRLKAGNMAILYLRYSHPNQDEIPIFVADGFFFDGEEVLIER